MNDAQKYAKKTAERYGVDITPEILERVRRLVSDVEIAMEVLPPPELNRWYDDEMVKNNWLRAKYGYPPFAEGEQPRPVSRRLE